MKTQLASPAGVPRHALDEEKTEAILRSIIIPPQPSELGALQQALSSGFLDNEMIIAALRSAVSVSNELIGIINTPFFGYADKIETIQEAIESLGQSNIVNIANAISLKHALCGSDYVDMEHYFCLADDCALVAAGIARELDILDPVQTYNLALLHDCGIPVLLHTFPNYAEILQLAFSWLLLHQCTH